MFAKMFLTLTFIIVDVFMFSLSQKLGRVCAVFLFDRSQL